MNRLAEQASPYLRQHAGNPVDWWPWCDEAFEQARVRDVPVLISVGYSACHWCHVMAHESFEDSSVAEVLNAGFVPLKVDREERPDIDAVYMEAVQLVSGGGGWPMTVLALPDGRPFWAGTYLPKEHFLDLLRRVQELWRSARDAITEDAERLTEAVRRGSSLPGEAHLGAGPNAGQGAGTLPGRVLGEAAAAVLARHDPEWGGNRGAPKFPQPATLELLAVHYRRNGDAQALSALCRALDAMSSGGIYDHLGGGFARYSTDRRWLVPHFEKMLYDNALLVRTYTIAWQLTGSSRYAQVVEETVGYLLSPPMRLDTGAWAAAEDADSEGVEGLFYTWDRSEIDQVAGADVADWYGATAEGNWEGRNILWRPGLADLRRSPAIEQGRMALYERRSHRRRPGLDDKVVTEWNAMAVAALAYAGAAFDRPDWVSLSVQTAEMLQENLRRPDGRWLRSWRQGAAGPLAFAADYAWLVEAFTRVFEATGEPRWLEVAEETAREMVRLFYSESDTVFFTCGEDAEGLVARMADLYDGATPSANATALAALARLAELTGHEDLRETGRRVLHRLAGALGRTPAAFPAMACAADLLERPGRQVVVAGDRPDLVACVHERYLPGTVLAWGKPFPSPLWEGRPGPDSAGLAFVCEGYRCRLPVGTVEDLGALLS
ncbi:MAG TPA: thioredoxin domain-containing protein [Acidimicrobiales bacterium]|nr:thioredoxin domain-containing protein [Acidimicrobiales bacterium]